MLNEYGTANKKEKHYASSILGTVFAAFSFQTKGRKYECGNNFRLLRFKYTLTERNKTGKGKKERRHA